MMHVRNSPRSCRTMGGRQKHLPALTNTASERESDLWTIGKYLSGSDGDPAEPKLAVLVELSETDVTVHRLEHSPTTQQLTQRPQLDA